MLKLKEIIPGIFLSLSFAVLSSVEAATITDDNLDSNGNVISVDDIELCFGQFDETLVLQNNCPQTPQELEDFFNPVIPGAPLPDALIRDFYDATFALNQFDLIFGDPISPGFNPSECNLSDPDGLEGLCFWDDPDAAALVVAQINTAIDNQNPTPALIVGEVPIPIPNTRDFYRIAHSVDENDSVISHQGRNINGNNPSWALPESLDLNIESLRNPAPGVLYPVAMYAQFNFTESDTTNRPEPPEPPEPPPITRVPESSSWVGMLFTGVCLIFANKKKG
ncbi:MAG: hypothetical protein QNJ64_02145 [Crocosphaera sp.]|nr:hypothetical protein [Crocosphaera sp.]